MLDGTFGCVRKESSGMSIEQPKHGDRFFLNQGLVDDFVAKHGKDSKGLRLVSNSNHTFYSKSLVYIKIKEFRRVLKNLYILVGILEGYDRLKEFIYMNP